MKRVRSWAVVFGAFAGGCAAGSADSGLEEDGGGGVNAPDALAPGDDGSPPEDAAPDDASSDEGPESEAGAKPNDAWIADAGIDSDPPDDSAPSWDASPPLDDATAPPVDLARAATAYTWQSMTSKTADTGRLPAPALNDGSLSTQVNIDSSSGDVANAWEAAGVIFGNPVTVAAVTFVQGKTGTSSGDGWFEANFGLQTSTDGTTWADCAWSANPAYAYSSAVSGKSFTFTGTAVAGVRGVRVVGQVNTVGSSWWEAANEVMVFGP